MEAEDLGPLNSPPRNDVIVGSAQKFQSLMMSNLSKDLHHNGDFLQIGLLYASYCDELSDASRNLKANDEGKLSTTGFVGWWSSNL